jgi:two-component system chemotaxis sensor kinase CheA
MDVAGVKAASARSCKDVLGMSDREIENLIFTAHVSTATVVTEISGRGVGLDVVRANIERLRGRAEVSSRPGQGTEFTVSVPITLAIVECLLVESGGQRFALPIASVLSLLPRDAREQRVAGQAMLTLGDTAVPVSDLASALELDGSDGGPNVIVSGAHARHGFRVEQLVGHRDLVIKGLADCCPWRRRWCRDRATARSWLSDPRPDQRSGAKIAGRLRLRFSVQMPRSWSWTIRSR